MVHRNILSFNNKISNCDIFKWNNHNLHDATFNQSIVSIRKSIEMIRNNTNFSLENHRVRMSCLSLIPMWILNSLLPHIRSTFFQSFYWNSLVCLLTNDGNNPSSGINLYFEWRLIRSVMLLGKNKVVNECEFEAKTTFLISQISECR